MKQMIIISAATAVMLCSCHVNKEARGETVDGAAPVAAAQPVPAVKPRGTVPPSAAMPAYLPNQIIYRTNGDWNDHVAIKIDGDKLIYYPDPVDVSAASAPLIMVDGWLMDRQGGISLQTAFLRWTYAEYHALKAAPSPNEIKAAIIPEAKVIEMRVLPIKITEARADTALVNKLIHEMEN